ncbi:MerR family transcriptional regulator [Bacillus pumilus]|nr:MerR family transcriptional regulator [Bacillus pumilus]
MKVKEVAELFDISIRTLHHYDEIGLLPPKEVSEAGYRFYSEENLETLQQILFFRELGFNLKEIKEIINNPSFDKQEAFILQRKMLMEKRNKLDRMIENIDKTLKHMRGEIHLTNKERFEGMNMTFNEYEEEARCRWGNHSIDNMNFKLSRLSKEEQDDLSVRWDWIFHNLASLRNLAPQSKEVQAAIREWYDFLNNHFTQYSLEAFYGLGQLYIQDERFTKNIDQYGEGLASFMSEAMKAFAVQQKRGSSDEHHN